MRLWSLLRRELLIGYRSGVESIIPVAFFFLVVGVFILTMGELVAGNSKVLVAVIWITTLFTNILSLNNLFLRDHADGTLAVALLHTDATITIVVTKLLAHWTITGLPITVFAPLVAFLTGMQPEHVAILGITLLIGTPTITLLGALVAALLVGLGRGGELLTVLILPLYIPILLFGIGVCHVQIDSGDYMSQLLWCLALLSGTLTVVPLALGPVLKLGQDS